MKFQMLLRKWAAPAMWSAGVLIAAALVLSHSFQCEFAANICYSVAFALCGVPVTFRAVLALRFKTVSIELLVTIAAVGACCIGELNESAAVTFLFQFGSYLEQKTVKKMRSAIKALTGLAPSVAYRITGGVVEEIQADEVEPNDILLVKTGGQIAADGEVVQGEGYAVEAGITGEPMPKHKCVGDHVYAGTILDGGTLQMRAAKVGEDTAFARIIALVEEAQDAKSPVERFIDRFARYYTPAVIALAVTVLALTRNVDTAITVLVLACPGALVIGAPIANVAGIGRGAREGILLKGGDSISTFAKTNAVVFDKTGTLTVGIPEVTTEKCYGANRTRVLALAASVEQASSHPLAQAIVRHAEGLPLSEASSVHTIKGCGMEAVTEGCHVLVGSRRLMENAGISLPERVLSDLKQLQSTGCSIVLAAVDGEIGLLLGISDLLRPDCADSICELRRLGVESLVLLTGDCLSAAEVIAKQLGLSEYHAELLPEDKMTAIRILQSQKKTVTFVGDGINDSPALAAADTGIAMGSGTDAAIDNSDVVLMRSDLKSLVRALRLSRRTVRIMHENIGIAVGTVVLLLAGLFAGYIHLSVGMFIHEASILAVILNAMRLLLHRKEKKS